MKAKELRQKSTEELRELLKNLRLELMKLNAERYSGKGVSNPGRIRQIKRDIARILTILKERGVE